MWHHPAYENLIIASEEATFDHGLVSPRPHHGGVGTTTQQQLDSSHDEGLASPGLACDSGKPGAEKDRDLLYDP
jgi:hypothetical protein